MRFGDLFRMSISSLCKRKVRTILTVLGVVIGTISIVLMVSLGIGLKSSMLEEIDNMANLKKIEVSIDEYSAGNNSDKEKDAKRLDDALVSQLATLPHVEMACPRMSSYVMMKYGKYICTFPLVGITAEEMLAMNLEVGEGELPLNPNEFSIFMGNLVICDFYAEKDYSRPYDMNGEPLPVDFMKDNVYLIIDTDAYYASQGGVSDGTQKKAKKYPLVCSGVMSGSPEEFKSEFSYQGIANIDAMIAMLKKVYKGRAIPGQPLNKKGKPYKDVYYNMIAVYVDDMSNVSSVQTEIQNMGYQCFSVTEFIESEMKSLSLIELVLGGIGAVSLFVAAIGIANTMMMSIYERTKEIGVMKVIGCRIRDIQLMFLFEAGLIGFFGGIIGVGISLALSRLINMLIAGSDMGFSYISTIPMWLVGLSLVFSTLIGMMAGFFPSQRAMKLSPLAAIRNE